MSSDKRYYEKHRDRLLEKARERYHRTKEKTRDAKNARRNERYKLLPKVSKKKKRKIPYAGSTSF